MWEQGYFEATENGKMVHDAIAVDQSYFNKRIL